MQICKSWIIPDYQRHPWNAVGTNLFFIHCFKPLEGEAVPIFFLLLSMLYPLWKKEPWLFSLTFLSAWKGISDPCNHIPDKPLCENCKHKSSWISKSSLKADSGAEWLSFVLPLNLLEHEPALVSSLCIHTFQLISQISSCDR